MPELEKSRQMLPFIHLSNLSVAEEAISNSFPQNFQHPKSSAGPKSPTPVLHPIKNPTAFLFLPPRELPTLTAAAARASELPLHSGAAKAPDDVPSGRKLARSSSEAGKKGPAEPPTCNYSHPHPRRQNTSIDSAPGELSLPDLPDHHVPLQKQPARTKANPNPRCASDHATHTHTHTTHLRNARLVDADPSPAGGAVARARPARQRGASQREGQSCAPGPTPRNPSPATIDRYGQKLTSETVGLLPVQRHHQVLPRPRLRRRLLGAPVQAEGVAGICGRRVRRGAGVRGVQLEPEAGGEGDQEAGMRWGAGEGGGGAG